MILETDRLRLRKLRQEDYAALCRILQDPEVMYAYEGAFSDEEVQTWLDNQLIRYRENGFGLWAVIRKETGQMIGQCGLTMQNTPEGHALEIGYLIEKAHWHKGYAIEAAQACRGYAFDVLGAQEVCSIIRDTNLASQRVAQRNGMKVRSKFIKHYRGIDMPHLMYVVRREEVQGMSMDFFEAIGNRHSYRGMYEDTKVPREELRKIMETGLAAPSGCNTQTTSLIGVDDPEVIKMIGRELGMAHFASAPAGIVVLTQTIPAYANVKFNVQDYSAAIMSMLLAIVAMGYESCWVEGDVTCDVEMNARMCAELGIPDGYYMVAYLPIGKAKSTPKAVKKKPFEDRAWWNTFRG